MSQEKVDKYKEQKKNRKKIIAREKRVKLIWTIIGIVVGVGLIAFIVLSIINSVI